MALPETLAMGHLKVRDNKRQPRGETLTPRVGICFSDFMYFLIIAIGLDFLICMTECAVYVL